MLMSVCSLDTLSVSVYGSHVLAVSSTVNRARGHRNQSLTFICTHVHLNQFFFCMLSAFDLLPALQRQIAQQLHFVKNN